LITKPFRFITKYNGNKLGYYFLKLCAPTDENSLFYQNKKIAQLTDLLPEAISIANQVQYFEKPFLSDMGN
jgi:hypothetical protein